MLQSGLEEIIDKVGVTAVVARQGSALSVYFMDHCPTDWHDLASHHDFELDTAFRRELVEHGIYVFPLATKQWSISAAHSFADVDVTLDRIESSLVSAVATTNNTLLI
jgi:glutamate-1-semialdehyde 2,1-aminomutase